MYEEDLKYECVMQIPSKICACKDAKKGTVKTVKAWLNGRFWLNRELIKREDLDNEKYFTKI